MNIESVNVNGEIKKKNNYWQENEWKRWPIRITTFKRLLNLKRKYIDLYVQTERKIEEEERIGAAVKFSTNQSHGLRQALVQQLTTAAVTTATQEEVWHRRQTIYSINKRNWITAK